VDLPKKKTKKQKKKKKSIVRLEAVQAAIPKRWVGIMGLWLDASFFFLDSLKFFFV